MNDKENIYNHKKIEEKWQAYWQTHATFRSVEDLSKPKYYVLDMFPFPSGDGLHVGHPVGYTATDIVARHKRQKGYNVLHPMGWDSFGLPAEQYAVRTGTHPSTTTQRNIANFRRQLQRLGFSYDWDREIATSDPRYYKWTQWIFTKLYEKGLAFEADLLVNYCPALGTVLANEEIENGRSKEGGHLVVRRPLRQWVLKITAYAERLLRDLETLDWPESLKKLQVNWIGRSEGALVDFEIEGRQEKLSVFTTRPDTLFGVSYIVLAPEHPLVDAVTATGQRAQVAAYRQQAAAKSDLERAETNKDKTGVWTGAYALHPVTGRRLPVWLADYVLMGYGTGGVMAVPAHDERDFEFAALYDLPILPVYEPLRPALEGMTEEEASRAILEGRACWAGDGIVVNSSGSDLSLDGLAMEAAKEKSLDWLESHKAGKRSVTYKLRDWLFSRQRYWGEPFPVLHLADGSMRPLELNELPLTLPDVQEYRPTSDGLSPLAAARDWVDLVDPKTGKAARRETNTMPNWAGSCWYYLRFCDPHNDQRAWDPEKESYWMPVDLYVGGVEHAVLHLLYARFWHKVLYDCGYVSTIEPFQSLRNQGLVTARAFQKEGGAYVEADRAVEKGGRFFDKETGEPLRSQVEKMSKSKLNGVSPDEIVEEFGADALRLYEMFMGPFEKEKTWNTDMVNGPRRFLARFYDLVTSDKLVDEQSEEAQRLVHRLVHQVGHDIEQMQFNTAVSAMMVFVNEFSKLNAYPRSALRMAAQALSPFAPHLAEEAWQLLGGKTTISYEPFPEADLRYLEDETVTYVVQVNGKLRGTFALPKDQSKEQLLALAKAHPQISKHLEGTVLKLIFVPNKLLNFVVSEK